MENDRNDMEDIKYQSEDVLTTIKNNFMNKRKRKKRLRKFWHKFLTQKKKKKTFFEVNFKNNGDVAFFLIHLIKLDSNVIQSSIVM